VNEKRALEEAGFSERKSCHKEMHKNWFEEKGFVASSKVVKIIFIVTFLL
jgi:hypothetical protein